MWDSMGLPFVSFLVCPGLIPEVELGDCAKISVIVVSRDAALANIFIDT